MSVTIDVHHHILPDFFWRETNDSARPVAYDASSAARTASGFLVVLRTLKKKSLALCVAVSTFASP